MTSSPRRLSIFCEAAGTSDLLLLCDCVAFHQRASCFKHSSHMSIPLLRIPSEQVEHFHTVVVGVSHSGAFAFSRLHLTLRSTQWARLEFVGRSRLLRLSESCILASLSIVGIFPPLLWDLVLPLVFASHLIVWRSPFSSVFPFFSKAQICRSPPGRICSGALRRSLSTSRQGRSPVLPAVLLLWGAGVSPEVYLHLAGFVQVQCSLPAALLLAVRLPA